MQQLLRSPCPLARAWRREHADVTNPEQLARQDVERLLMLAGRAVQDVATANRHERGHTPQMMEAGDLVAQA
jgi:hypothetical protein